MGDLAKGARMVRVDLVGVGAAEGIWATTGLVQIVVIGLGLGKVANCWACLMRSSRLQGL